MKANFCFHSLHAANYGQFSPCAKVVLSEYLDLVQILQVTKQVASLQHEHANAHAADGPLRGPLTSCLQGHMMVSP